MASKARKTAKEWQEEEERQLALAIKQSLEGTADPFNEVRDLSQDGPSLPAKSRDQTPSPLDELLQSAETRVDVVANFTPEAQPQDGPSGDAVDCPICGIPIHGSNDQLNAHIDTCLNKAELGTSTTSSTRNSPSNQTSARDDAPTGASKKKQRGPLDSFVRRSKG